jgi:hypothetical protein
METELWKLVNPVENVGKPMRTVFLLKYIVEKASVPVQLSHIKVVDNKGQSGYFARLPRRV